MPKDAHGRKIDRNHPCFDVKLRVLLTLPDEAGEEPLLKRANLRIPSHYFGANYDVHGYPPTVTCVRCKQAVNILDTLECMPHDEMHVGPNGKANLVSVISNRNMHCSACRDKTDMDRPLKLLWSPRKDPNGVYGIAISARVELYSELGVPYTTEFAYTERGGAQTRERGLFTLAGVRDIPHPDNKGGQGSCTTAWRDAICGKVDNSELYLTMMPKRLTRNLDKTGKPYPGQRDPDKNVPDTAQGMGRSFRS